MSAGTVNIEPENSLILKLKSGYNSKRNKEIIINSDIAESNKEVINSIEDTKI